jgi:hypothetical protein
MAAVVVPEALPQWGPFAALVICGTVGVVGWARAKGATPATSHGSLETTIVCLGVGCGAAAATLGWIAWSSAALPRDPGLLALAGGASAALLVMLLGGLGWIARLGRGFAVHTGRRFDALPAMFLLIALAQAAVAALAALRLGA